MRSVAWRRRTRAAGRSGNRAQAGGRLCTPTQGVWQPDGCVSCEPVCVCVSLVRVVIICPASTHTALVSSPSLWLFFTFLPTYLLCVCDCVWAAPTCAIRRVGGLCPGGVRCGVPF